MNKSVMPFCKMGEDEGLKISTKGPTSTSIFHPFLVPIKGVRIVFHSVTLI